MHKLLLLFFLGLGSRVAAQDTTQRVVDSTSPVVVQKDARIDQLVKKQIEINEATTREAFSSHLMHAHSTVNHMLCCE